MSIRFDRRQRLFAALLFILSLSVALLPRVPMAQAGPPSSIFSNGMNANLVLGQSDFTSSASATTQTGMQNPSGVAVDGNSRVWVTDHNNNRVLFFGSFASTDASLTNLALSSGTLSPVFASAATSYGATVANSISSLMLTPTVATGATITINGVSVASGSTSSAIPLALGPNTITIVVTAADGVTTKTYTIIVARADAGQSFAIGQPANLVLGQPDFTSNATAATQSGMRSPYNITVDPTTGKVFVSDRQNNRVLRFASRSALTNGAAAEAVLGQLNFTSNSAATTQSGMSSPSKMTIDSAGRLWVSDSKNNRVLRFDSAVSKANGANADGVLGQSNFTSNANVTTQSGLDSPYGLAVDSAGRLWVADYSNSRVLRFDNAASKANGANADGVLGEPNFTSIAFVSTQSGMSSPLGVAVSSDGRLWVADSGNSRVLWFNNAASKANGANADGVLGQGNFTSSASATTQTGMQNPNGVTVDSIGGVWVADSNNSRALFFGSLFSNDATMSSLGTGAVTLSPAFAPTTTSYTATVGNSVSSVSLTPTVAAGATVTINGVTVPSGSASGAIPLTVGVNIITIVVTAEDGITTKTYTITITRAAVTQYIMILPIIVKS